MSRLRSLSWRERLLLLQAAISLPVVALALRRAGLTRVQARLSTWSGVPSGPRDAEDARATARRVAWCVYAGATYGPWPANCLQRSLVLWWLLRRRAIESDLRIGVRRSPEADEALDFHAWVEYEGDILNDASDVRQRYATFDQAIAPRTATFR